MIVRATAGLGTLAAGSLLLILYAAPAQADEFTRNAWGFYGGPTTYELTHSSSEYNRATSSTSLDVGVYYTRFTSPAFSLRVEARVTDRHIDLATGADEITRLDEHFLEIPIIFQADRRSKLGDGEIRISSGIGLCYGVLIGQERMVLSDNVEENIGFGAYQRVSLLFDGGATLDVTSGSGIFLRFRLQYDTKPLGTTSDVDLTTEYLSYGFYAGLESPF